MEYEDIKVWMDRMIIKNAKKYAGRDLLAERAERRKNTLKTDNKENKLKGEINE